MLEETTIEARILKEVSKKFIKRIKALQLQLQEEIKDRSDFGGYEDCGQSYQEQVVRTEAKIQELVSQKISIEKWRKFIIHQNKKP